MKPFDFDALDPAARQYVTELEQQRADLLGAALSDSGVLPDHDRYVREHFKGDWSEAVRFAVNVIVSARLSVGERPNFEAPSYKAR